MKTLAWRYAVGGHPFIVDTPDEESDALFVQRCRDIMRDLDTLDLAADGASQITDDMRRLRAAQLQTRKDAYERGRIADQQAWYSARATWNQKRRVAWQLALMLLEIGGLLAAIARVADWIDIDLLGFAARARQRRPHGCRLGSTSNSPLRTR